MIQQDFPRTPSPVYQKPVSRPTKAETIAHAQARELALEQLQQQRAARQQQGPSPMYYPEPIEQQMHARMHGLTLNDAQVSRELTWP